MKLISRWLRAKERQFFAFLSNLFLPTIKFKKKHVFYNNKRRSYQQEKFNYSLMFVFFFTCANQVIFGSQKFMIDVFEPLENKSSAKSLFGVDGI